MKKVLSIIIVIFITNNIKAQFRIIDPSTNSDVLNSYTVQISPGSPTHSFDFEIQNNYSSTKTIKIKRYLLQYTSGQDVYYCFGTNCYTANSSPAFIPTQNVTLSPGGTLPNGAGTYGLKTDFDDNNVIGNSLVRYTLYDVNNASDSLSFTINYEVGSVGIKQIEQVRYTMSSCMPNPAKNYTNIIYEIKNFNGNAKLILNDIIGNKLKDFKIEEPSGNLKIDLTEFNKGIYFYTLQINNKNMVSRKLIIE
jgi:hypothetical protein